MAGELIPPANRLHRRAQKGSALEQRLADMAKDILPEVALRLAVQPAVDDIKEVFPNAKVNVSVADGAEGRLCNSQDPPNSSAA